MSWSWLGINTYSVGMGGVSGFTAVRTDGEFYTTHHYTEDTRVDGKDSLNNPEAVGVVGVYDLDALSEEGIVSPDDLEAVGAVFIEDSGEHWAVEVLEEEE